MNPQHIVYLIFLLLTIGIMSAAIDPMSPESVRIIEEYCGMNDIIGECLWAIFTKPEPVGEWHHIVITYDGTERLSNLTKVCDFDKILTTKNGVWECNKFVETDIWLDGNHYSIGDWMK